MCVYYVLFSYAKSWPAWNVVHLGQATERECEKGREGEQAVPSLCRAVSSEINSIFCPSATHGNCTKNNNSSGSHVAGRVL